jgi:hypothetical protein
LLLFLQLCLCPVFCSGDNKDLESFGLVSQTTQPSNIIGKEEVL